MKKTRVLVIGGYGHFGRLITEQLAQEEDIQVIIGARNEAKARECAQAIFAHSQVIVAKLDINANNFEQVLSDIAPRIVIHTSGPFQEQDYKVAKACIAVRAHYIDLADAHQFVTQIKQLDQEARNNRVLICSGASSVPAFTSALIDHYQSEFSVLESVEYGIATAQKTNRGLATLKAVLSYAGKPFDTLIHGNSQRVYGWQSLHTRSFWNLGKRLLAYCDIPDLSLFAQRYPSLKTIRFKAALELRFLQVILFLMSGLVRYRFVSSLTCLAPFLLKTAQLFDFLGSEHSGFYMQLSGKNLQAKHKKIVFDLLAHNGDGLYIPVTAAILLALKLARGQIHQFGAMPCMGFISLQEYLFAWARWQITYRMQNNV